MKDEHEAAGEPPEPGGGTCFCCGAATGIRLGDRWICEGCYSGLSSCCAGFED